MLINSTLYLDELTGAYNRKYLFSYLDHEIKKIKRYGGKLSILFVDLDNFKIVNDLMGHLEGDRILVEFVKLIKSNLRESDIITRYGGDEFVIVLPHTPAENAASVAQRILDSLKSKEQSLKMVSCSIGIVEIPTHGLDFETILSKADKALYRAKRLGKARYIIYSEETLYPQIPSKTFVGRHAEKTELLNFLRKEKPFILVRGSTGIGKTRFVSEILKLVDFFTKFETSCFGTLSSLPFVPFKELLKKVKESNNLKFREFYVKLDEFGKRSLLPLLPEGTEELTKNIDRFKFYETVFDLLVFLSGDKNALIFIDDIQWMDKSSSELLYYLLRLSKGKLKFLATARNEEIPGTPIEALLPTLSREGLMLDLELGPLSEATTYELIESILQAPAEEKLKKVIYVKSGGNPLFVEELIKELYTREQIKFGESEWQILQDEITWVPESIELLLKNKLAMFVKDPVLEVAAVIGKEFDLQLIQNVTNMNFGQILDSIDKLLRNNLIEEKGIDKFAFKEDLIRNTVLAGISKTKKSYYSSLILNVIENSLKSMEGKEELCAYHARQAGDTERLKKYSLEAAKKLANIFAYDESIKFYQWYLEVEEDLKKKEEAFLSYIRILEVSGQLKKAIQETRTFIEKYGGTPELYKALAELYIESGDTRSASEYIEKSLQEKFDPSAITLKSWVLRRLNRINEAKQLLDELLSTHLNSLGEETLATAYTIQGLNYGDLNDIETALDFLNKAEEIRRKLNLIRGVGSVHVNKAIIYSHIGEYEKALKEYDKAEECYQKTGYKSGLLTVLNNKASVYLDLNQYQQALYNFRKTFYEAEKVFDRHLQVMSLNNVGVTLRTMEQHEEALEVLKRALDMGIELEMKDVVLNIKRNLAYTYASGFKDLEKAVPIIESVLSEFGGVGLTYPSIIAHLHAIEIYMIANKFDKSLDISEKLLQAIETYPFKELKVDFYVKYALLNKFYANNVDKFREYIHKAYRIIRSNPTLTNLRFSFLEGIADILIYSGKTEGGLKILKYLIQKAEKSGLDQESERLTRKIKKIMRLFVN